MEYLHQAHYGNAGGEHTAKPMYMKDGNNIYATRYHPEGASSHPIYRVDNGKVYATAHHPQGQSLHALYHITGDAVHTTAFHPQHVGGTGPAFILKPHI